VLKWPQLNYLRS